jgi:hypothetical protein
MATSWKFAAGKVRSLLSRAAPFLLFEPSEESLVLWSGSVPRQPEMFESLASCFAFHCGAWLNMTD